MFRNLALFLVAVLTVNCAAQELSIPGADSDLNSKLAVYQKLDSKHHAVIAKKDEPGERLLVLARLLSLETDKPISNLTIGMYQADINGSYGEQKAGDESTARISGDVTTDSEGRFMISTVLPGDYGTRSGNRHIHLSVPGAKPVAYDFFFDNYVGVGTRFWVNGSDQAILLELKKTDGGVLIATADLKVKGYVVATDNQ